MPARKPIEEGCTGGIDCQIKNHVVHVQNGKRWTIKHITLTPGQHKTLWERSMERGAFGQKEQGNG